MILPKSDAKDFLDYFKWYSEQKSANENPAIEPSLQ